MSVLARWAAAWLRPRVTPVRLPGNPIIRPGMLGADGDNINGPSLIVVPSWVAGPRARYYLYFAHHRGSYIRLAYADDLGGPWRIHPGGVLSLSHSRFVDHIASPDVVVDEAAREIRMYYHGVDGARGGQWTRLAVSADGLQFVERQPIVAHSYLRVVAFGGGYQGVARPRGAPRLCWSPDGVRPFVDGPEILDAAVRHCALQVCGGHLQLFYTVRGDCPEAIRRVRLTPPRGGIGAWRVSSPETVLGPELVYEGADCPLAPSAAGQSHGRVRQLRDPAVYVEGNATYLAYAVAGESGLAIARLLDA
jgi:hypothetical protein